MKKLITLVALTLIAVSLPSKSGAQSMLTFDDVNVNSSGYFNISWGNTGGLYDGINWVAGSSGDVGIINPHYYYNGVYQPLSDFSGTSGFGYANGLVSGNNVMDLGGTASMNAQSGYTFDLISGYFTSAWNDNTTFTLAGFRNGTQLYSQTFTLDTLSPTLETLNFVGVDQVKFLNNSSTFLAADNLNFNLNGAPGAPASVPEPSTYALLGLGALGLVVAARRRKA